MVEDRSTLVTVTALCTLAAGGVHAAAAYQHDLGTLLGAGMAATAVLQVVGAALLLTLRARTRLVTGAVTAVNAGALLTGVLAHTTGLPLPGMRTAAEFDGQLVAVLCLEAAATLAGLVALNGTTAARPADDGQPEVTLRRAPRLVVATTAIAVLAAAVPAAAKGGHDHTAAGGHTGSHTASGHPEAAHPNGADHDAGATRYAAFTAGLSPEQVTAAVNAHADWLTTYLTQRGVTEEVARPFSRRAMSDALSSPEGNGGHGHTGPSPWKPIPDQATRDTLAAQLAAARAAALALPTAAKARDAGYVMVAPFLPGLGAHYLNAPFVLDGKLDPAKPEILLYSSNQPDARVVGVSYLVPGSATQEPEGLAGPNDVFHFHDRLCLVGRMALPVMDEKACASVGGRVGGGFGGITVWMNHVWVVPGWESPWGLFSSENPEITIAVGVPG